MTSRARLRRRTSPGGRSPRGKKHEDKLRSIDAWSTLHAIETLSDEQYEQFEAASGEGPVSLTRADVERFKSGTRAKPSNFSEVAVIKADVSRTKPEDVAKIEQEVDALSKRLEQFPAVLVENKGLAERLTVKREVELDKTASKEQERAVRAARRRLHEVFAREIARMPSHSQGSVAEAASALFIH